MDDGRRSILIAGSVVPRACGLSYRDRRTWRLIVASVSGSALGAVAFPRLLGLWMGYRAAMDAPSAPFWWKEFHELIQFYTIVAVADSIPRGAALGLLVGLIGGFLWPLRRRKPETVRPAPVT